MPRHDVDLMEVFGHNVGVVKPAVFVMELA